MNHIKELTIHDYKGIHNLTLSGLNQINLLTGNNNSGKTSILELLCTLQQPEQLWSWNYGSRSPDYFGGICRLFPVDSDSLQISYSYIDDQNNRNKIELKGELIETKISPRDILEQNQHSPHFDRYSGEQPDQIEDMNQLQLTFYLNERIINKDNLFDKYYWLQRPYRTSQASKVHYILPESHTDDVFFSKKPFDSNSLYKRLISVLKKFDDDIISVNTERDGFRFQYLIRTEKHETPLPISSYGDGMKKAILLLGTTVLSENGILLVDEFETGIHTSGMDFVFRTVLESAIEMNVQVFLTSHSKEAVDKVLELSKQCPILKDKISLFTLYQYQGKHIVRGLTATEALRARDHLGLELR